MAHKIVEQYYAKTLHLVYDSDDSAQSTCGNQLEEYSLVKNNIMNILNKGTFLLGGKDEHVNLIPVLFPF